MFSLPAFCVAGRGGLALHRQGQPKSRAGLGATFELEIATVIEPASLRALIERPVELAHYQALFPTRRVRHLRLSNNKSVARKEAFEMAELEILADCAVESLPGCPSRTPRSRSRSGS